MPTWFVYILRCADGTLYTGVTTDLERRLQEHNAGGRLGARYTRARLPVALLHQESASSRAEACKREAAIKKHTRDTKLALANSLPSASGDEKRETGAARDRLGSSPSALPMNK